MRDVRGPAVRIVLEGPPGCSRPDVERLRAAGIELVEGFRPRARRIGTICIGEIVDRPGAEDALLAAIAGAGLVIEARTDRQTTDRLVDDLRRLGPVDHRILTAVEDPPTETALSVEARAILGLMAMGLSLADAARALGLARRTADRRLAEARHGLGVSRTAEAVARARLLGWLDRPREVR